MQGYSTEEYDPHLEAKQTARELSGNVDDITDPIGDAYRTAADAIEDTLPHDYHDELARRSHAEFLAVLAIEAAWPHLPDDK